MAIKILTDSTSDITREEGQKLGVSIVPLNVQADGKTYEDGVTLSTEEFYRILETSKELPRTSQPSPEVFLRYFREAKENGDDLVVILIGSCISGTVQSATLAKNMAEYDRIFIIDSESGTCGLTLLVKEAVKMVKEGKTAEEIVDKVHELIERTVFFALLDTLDYVIKGGRISKTAGAVGSLIKLKPLVTLHKEGVKMVDKARGTNSGYRVLLQHMKEEPVDEDYPVYFGYTDDKTQCLDFQRIAVENMDISNMELRSSGCVIGTYAGPGAVIVAYIRK